MSSLRSSPLCTEKLVEKRPGFGKIRCKEAVEERIIEERHTQTHMHTLLSFKKEKMVLH